MKNAVPVLLIAFLLWFGLTQRDVTPPGPTPDPVPPVVVDPPPPVVDVKPLIDGDGLHVLIVEEVDDRRSLSRDQLAIITSSTLRGWFTDHKAAWKVWDQNMDTSHEPAKWQAAMKIERASLPWLIVSCKGKPNFSGPLPATMDATLEVLGKYATAGASE